MKMGNTKTLCFRIVEVFAILAASVGGYFAAAKFSEHPLVSSFGSAVAGILALKLLEEKETDTKANSTTLKKTNQTYQSRISYHSNHAERIRSETTAQAFSKKL